MPARLTLAECEARYQSATSRAALAHARRDARRTAHALGVPCPDWAKCAVAAPCEPMPIAALPMSATPPEVRAWQSRTGGRVGFAPGGVVVVRGPIAPRGPHVDRIYPTLAAAAAAVA